jgi:hypothetical protein
MATQTVDSMVEVKVAHLAAQLAVDWAAVREYQSADRMVDLRADPRDLLKAGRLAACSGNSTVDLRAALSAFQMAAKMVDLWVAS